ncbi:hypothetical protein OF001_U290040 [Pseudomonas sp. OF001]|nr:hypothetical protein OF001_U290040 [Pseudomonas sp. OF001]
MGYGAAMARLPGGGRSTRYRIADAEQWTRLCRCPPYWLLCKQKCGRLAFGTLHLEHRDRRAFEIATAMLRLCEHCGGPLGMAQVHARCVCSVP